MRHYLAIDIGASSGRHIVGWSEGGTVQTKEVYRFPNGVTERNGHLTWDMDALLGHVRAGIDKALDEFGTLDSFSIDTWGCDYVLLKGDEEVWPCHAYRDNRTEALVPAVHENVPFEELYARIGCQFQPFNTIYQLCVDLQEGRLTGITDFLMVPEYLLWKLTGVKAKEYTNATTTGLVNAETGEFDLGLVKKLGLPENLFPTLSRPGTAVGQYKGVPAVLCATHDTASAVDGIPMEGEQLYISSGTWSLLGVKTPEPLTDKKSMAANWSNEGGVGYNRYQKNIMGMWIVNRLRDELCPDKPFPEIVAQAEASAFDGTVDANASCFLAPDSMRDAFDGALSVKPESAADYFRCAYRSLALSYRDAIRELEENIGKTYEKLYIVGGGAKNGFLNRLTEEVTGKQVVALPIEATAQGNLKIQMEAISC
ncbi:MAG: rhamnulokinase [Oscillospiraceae bacterium]|jgi:rhamnulokinase|nr:rhamnulokinase [Oscillospiraceae bacterium]